MEYNPVCLQVNQEYCHLQGYEWAEAVLSKEEMLASVSPRNHCTWYKVCTISDHFDQFFLIVYH